MKKLDCPYCNAGLTVPDDYVGSDVTCPSCGQSFFLDENDVAGAASAGATPPPPRPQRPPRAPQAAFMQRGPGGTFKKPQPPSSTTVKESRAKVGNWFIGLWVLSAFLIVLGTAPGSGILISIGCLVGSVVTIVWFSLLLSYVRTIALNSERR